MKAFWLLVALSIASAAQAATECKQIGRSTVCTGDKGIVITCKKIGRSWVCDKD